MGLDFKQFPASMAADGCGERTEESDGGGNGQGSRTAAGSSDGCILRKMGFFNQNLVPTVMGKRSHILACEM